MTVVHAVVVVEDVVSGISPLQIAVVVGAVVAHDVLRASLNGVYFANGGGIVYLESVLRAARVYIAELVADKTYEVSPVVSGFAVSVVVGIIAAVWRC